MNTLVRNNDERIDELEAVLLELPQVHCPVTHRFTKGIYIREIFMPKDTVITSKIHNTNHPFVVSKGAVSVQIDMGEWEYIEAPYTGITKAGTRRVLLVDEDCIWTTFHPIDFITGDENELSDEEKEEIADSIEEIIITKHTNILAHKKQGGIPCHTS